MKRQRMVCLFAVLFFVWGVSAAALAQGWILPRLVTSHPKIPLMWPVLQKSSLHFRVKEQAGRVVLEQIWKNPTDHSIEGQWVLPLPEGSQITRFKMTVGDTVYSGQILERDRARQLYEDIVRQLRDPALFEFAGRNLFRSEFFPLRAHE